MGRSSVGGFAMVLLCCSLGGGVRAGGADRRGEKAARREREGGSSARAGSMLTARSLLFTVGCGKGECCWRGQPCRESTVDGTGEVSGAGCSDSGEGDARRLLDAKGG